MKQESTPTDADVSLALDGGLVKRRVVPVVAGVRVGTGPQQQRHHLGVAERAGVMQRDQTAVIPGVDTGPQLEQVVHHLPPAVT